MADDRRVEPKPMLVGRGSGTTPERIEQLRKQADDRARATRKPPSQPFSAVLAKGRDKPDSEPESEAEEESQDELPEKGPRPGLVHPSQKESYGREGKEGKDVVILKG